MNKIISLFRFLVYYYRFRKRNRHNNVRPANIIPSPNVAVGHHSYGDLHVVWLAPLSTKLVIGNYCSLGPDVKFLVGGDHNYHRISTWPFQSLVYHQPTLGNEKNRDIVVEDDVWIGMESLIMSGVRIGKGSVIGARSIVTKDVPPYSVFVGTKVVRKRFPDTIINKIQVIDFNVIEHTHDDDYAAFCKTEVTDDNADEVLGKFDRRQ